MENFTPLPAFIGGLMIGAAALMLLALNGRIAGVSGILGGVLSPSGDAVGWRIAFLAGLIAAPLIYLVAQESNPEISMTASPMLLVSGGLLVGFGTAMGRGCTSGHGVCGLGRLSVRSLVMTLTFMAAAGVTVFISRHVIGVQP